MLPAKWQFLESGWSVVVVLPSALYYGSGTVVVVAVGVVGVLCW
jgi:hypothetical protein